MIKWKIRIAVVFLSLFFCSFILVQSRRDNYKPKDGYVPNQETALKIAEAIWLPVYGEKIYENKPFTARLEKGVWIVEGTVYTTYGGGPHIEIRKEDCRILKMYHEK